MPGQNNGAVGDSWTKVEIDTLLTDLSAERKGN